MPPDTEVPSVWAEAPAGTTSATARLSPARCRNRMRGLLWKWMVWQVVALAQLAAGTKGNRRAYVKCSATRWCKGLPLRGLPAFRRTRKFAMETGLFLRECVKALCGGRAFPTPRAYLAPGHCRRFRPLTKFMAAPQWDCYFRSPLEAE